MINTTTHSSFAAQKTRTATQRPSAKMAYHTYCRPKLVDLLEALALDVTYERAAGNYVYYGRERDGSVAPAEVLDLVGGFGSCLFGHNNPELQDHLINGLRSMTPAFVQGAVRGEAARLAEELNEQLPTSGRYYCIFSNSGAEAVEAAVKHAYKARLDAVVEAYESVSRRLADFFWAHEEDDLDLPDTFDELSKLRDRIEEHNLAQFEAFQHAPVMCALKGSFHGKTTSALKLTFNKTYRESFEGLSTVETAFFEANRPERIAEIVREKQISFLIPEVSEGRVSLVSESMTRVMAVVLEVIQGEGGVRPVPTDTLRSLAEMHPDLGVPYIVDEVQTGFGRTGAIASYTNTPLGAIEPDYLVFGKAMGGGISKVSATLIHESISDPDFALLHTSTFGEDELSCSLARKALGMLVRRNGAILKEVSSKGEYFLRELRRLQEKHPTVVRDVRGRGLMLGMEFGDLDDHGNLFRYAGQKGFVSLLVSSYLLHRHDIRVTAPLSTLYKGNPGKRRASVIRLQPGHSIRRDEIDRVIAAIDEVLSLIERQDEFALLAHLVGVLDVAPQVGPEARPAVPDETATDFDARVGFVINITRLEHLVDHYLPSFKGRPYDPKRLTKWWNRLCRFLEPEVVHRTTVESDGFVVEANLIAVPYLAEQMIRTFAGGRRATSHRSARLRLKELRDKVREAAILARDLGDERVPTSIVGLGAFTSIVTRNGMDMNDFEIPVTTGNTYTTALMLQAIRRAAELRDLDLTSSTVAVVGAAGNIGSTLAELLARDAGRVILIGRGGRASDERLHAVASRCNGAKVDLGSMDDLADCDVVAIATNSTNARLVGPESVKSGAIVACASVPSNLSESFAGDPGNHFVFDGGYAQLPDDSAIDFVGMPEDGLAFGCLSETLLLGFEGANRSFAKGDVTAAQVLETIRMAEDYEFELGRFQLGGEPLDIAA